MSPSSDRNPYAIHGYRACRARGVRPMRDDTLRTYRGVIIWPKNYAGMYSARVDVPGGGQSLAADTLEGMRGLIRYWQGK